MQHHLGGWGQLLMGAAAPHVIMSAGVFMSAAFVVHVVFIDW